MHPLARAHQPVHLQLFHATVGAHAQLSTRGTYLGKYELLQLRIALENLSPNSACHHDRQKREGVVWWISVSRETHFREKMGVFFAEVGLACACTLATV